MNRRKIVSLLALGIGVGTAMSVALDDISAGIALGAAAVAAFAFQKGKTIESE